MASEVEIDLEIESVLYEGDEFVAAVYFDVFNSSAGCVGAVIFGIDVDDFDPTLVDSFPGDNSFDNVRYSSISTPFGALEAFDNHHIVDMNSRVKLMQEKERKIFTVRFEGIWQGRY